MRIEVYRGAGERPGPDIEAPLLEGSAMLIERGRVEMDRNAHQFVAVEAEIVPRAGVRLGKLASIDSPTSAAPGVGKIVGISLSGSGGDLVQRVSLERPE